MNRSHTGLLARTDEDITRQLRAAMPDVIADLRAKTANVERPAREAGYTIQNKGDEAVVRIYDEIWELGVNALDLTADLDALDTKKIRVEINSPGGNVFDGIAIYNALRLHPAHVTTRVDGIAASIASVIAQAGDHRVMVASSQMMIHNAWGLAVGHASDHADMADLLGKQDAVIAGIYATRSDKPADHFRSLMDAETWMDADEALSQGLADEVLQPVASASLTEKIAALSGVVIDDVERLVATHGELTGAKRGELVALRDRIDGLLPTPEPEAAVDDFARRLAQRDLEFRAAIPPQFL